MMKIKSVCIEGMHNVLEKEYNFNDVNYLYGNNGAGKSTALQAVQLALLGYIPGTNKTGSAIYRHARSKAMTVTATLVSADGQEIIISRSWIGSGSSVKSTVEVSPKGFPIEDLVGELELPIFNFNDFTNMTANKLKEWFINFLPSTQDEIDWSQELKDSLGDMIPVDPDVLPSFIKEIETMSKLQNLSGVDLVKAVNSKLKEKISFQKGQLDRLQGTIQSLIFYDDGDADCDVEELRRQISCLNDLKSQLIRYQSEVAANNNIKKMIDSIITSAETLDEDEEYKDLRNKYSEYVKKMHDMNNDLHELNSKAAQIRSEISTKSSVIRGGGICPYTSSSCESISALVDKLKKDVEVLESQLIICEADIKKTKASHQECNRFVSDCLAKLSMIDKTYEKKSSLVAQLRPDPECPTIMTEAGILDQINALNDRIIKSEANKRYNELTNKLTADKYKIESNIQVYKLWDKLTGANGLQSTMMTKPFYTLASEMDKHLHIMFNDKDVTTKFNLSEKANSFSFGLERNGKYIPFDLLSSGEKCLYTVALMMCLTSKSKSMLKLILIDDLLDHLDDNNAKSLFESLYKVKDIQFILAGVQKCNIDNAHEILIEVK